MKKLKYIIEMIFIFGIPLMLLLFGLKINKTYDENGNETNKYLSYENGIFREYNDNLEYKYTIDNFNIFDEKWEIGSLDWNTGQNIENDNFIRSKNYIEVNELTTYYVKTPNNMNGLIIYTFAQDYTLIQEQISSTGNNNFTFTTDSNVKYIRFRSFSQFRDTNVKDTNINISSIFNGNYTPYEKPLIIYSNDEYTSDYTYKEYNYTWYDRILNTLIVGLQFNNNYMIQFIFIYLVLILVMSIIWHLIIRPIDFMIHLWDRKKE